MGVSHKYRAITPHYGPYNISTILSLLNRFIIPKKLHPEFHVTFLNTVCILTITIYHTIYSGFLCETATVPSLNPFRNFCLTTDRCRVRPVPVVLRLLA